MDRAKIVDYYLNKIDESDFDILKVRQELEKNNIDEQEIKIIIRLIDNEFQRRLLTKSTSSKLNELIWVGAVLTVVGAAITIGTFTGMIKMGTSVNSYLIVYGPCLAGLSILLGGLAKRK